LHDAPRARPRISSAADGEPVARVARQRVFGETVDKTLQKADWSARPLSEEHFRYAAADTTWCAQLRTALEAIEKPPPPEQDSPEAIDAEFSQAKLEDLTANAELKVLRESVRELMRREGLTRFSRFAVWDAERLEVPILAFVAEVERVDPARMLDLDMRVTKEKLDLLNGGLERVLGACRTSQSTRFQMPRMQRPRGSMARTNMGEHRGPAHQELAIGEDTVAALAPATNAKSSAVIRWCSKSDVVGVEAQESRWWSDSAEDGEV